jgi:PucR C-terminal helix-turn-helix domain
VKDLEVRLAALDPDAGAALRVIAYFDKLTETGAGLEAIVRGAAVLAGCPARLADEQRRLRLRAEPDGASGPWRSPADPSWLRARVEPEASEEHAGAVLWLERHGPAGPVEAMVLERAAAAARALRTRAGGGPRARPGDSATEVLIDPAASAEARRHAAHLLGLTAAARFRAVAQADGSRTVPAIWAEPAAHGTGTRASDSLRTGVGPAVTLEELPESWAAARMALRLTAAGTEEDPGPRTVRYDELGALALLAECATPASPLTPDELALEHAAVAAPWMLETLQVVVTTASLRAAASVLLVHHSTLQERIAAAERLLGWAVRQPEGGHRLYLALALRRLRHHPRT